MFQTENPNQNQDNRQQTPLEQEFQQSQTYRTIRELGGKVMRGLNDAGITSEKVTNGINTAARELNRAVDSITRELNTRKPNGTPVQEPKQAAKQGPEQMYYHQNTAPQNNGGYTYVPPQRQGTHTQVPPRPGQHHVQPVPPPQKPNMVVKRKPSNVKFWITGIVCALYALNMPMNDWFDLAVLGIVGAGIFTLSRLIFRGRKYLVPEEIKQPEPEKKPEPKPEPAKKANTGDPEVDKIIDEGYEYLRQLRTANDHIEDAVMSDRISRMEAASADIFAYIAEHPEKAAQIRRFMNYYLPTTLKLLTSYDKLSRQRVKGENIQKTMFDIEGMMETIASAFEKQLDGLFSEDAMDIAADISVMESILKQEGLSGDENVMPKVKTTAKGNKAVQTEEGGMPTLTLDLEDEEE